MIDKHIRFGIMGMGSNTPQSTGRSSTPGFVVIELK